MATHELPLLFFATTEKPSRGRSLCSVPSPSSPLLSSCVPHPSVEVRQKRPAGCGAVTLVIAHFAIELPRPPQSKFPVLPALPLSRNPPSNHFVPLDCVYKARHLPLRVCTTGSQSSVLFSVSCLVCCITQFDQAHPSLCLFCRTPWLWSVFKRRPVFLLCVPRCVHTQPQTAKQSCLLTHTSSLSSCSLFRAFPCHHSTIWSFSSPPSLPSLCVCPLSVGTSVCVCVCACVLALVCPFVPQPRALQSPK